MSRVLEAFRGGLQAGAFPGGQIGVLSGSKMFLHAEGLLHPGGPQATIDSVYDLASLTKPLATGVLVGRAIEAGELSLDDPLSRFLPGAKDLPIARILEHAAGFPAHRRFDREVTGVPFGTAVAYHAIVERALGVDLVTEPGTKVEYSDVGYILLGAALENIFAEPLSVAFARLGFTGLHFRDRRGPPAPPPGPPHTIAPTENGLVGEVHDENARAMGGVAGHAGLFGTARAVLDVAGRLIAGYHGEEDSPLRPSTIHLLFTPSRVPGSSRTYGWDRPSGGPSSSTGGRWPEHAVGHLGFTGTSLWIDPERRLAAALITNRVCPTRANEKIKEVRPKVYDAVWQEWVNGS